MRVVSLFVHRVGSAVRARHDAHASIFHVRIRQADPARHFLLRIESVVRRILMPRHEPAILRLLGEHRCAEQQDIRPDDRLDRIKDVRIARQRNDPGRCYVGFDLELLLAFFAQYRVIAVELRNAGCSLLAADRIERESITLPTEMLDLRFTETTRPC